MKRAWWVPLTGVAFIVLVFVGFALMGEPPDVKDNSVQEIVDHYVDNKDGIMVGVSISMIGAVLFLFFASYLRDLLRRANAEVDLIATVGFAGAVILAAGAAIDSTISFTLAETVDDIEPDAVQALQALWDNDFVPFVLGAGTFLFANGLAIVRSGALPKWLGWAGIVIAIFGFIPHEISFIAFPASALWVLITSITATINARSETTGAGPTGAPAAPPPSA